MLEGSAGVYLCWMSSFRTGIKSTSGEDLLLLTAAPVDSMSKELMMAA